MPDLYGWLFQCSPRSSMSSSTSNSLGFFP